MVIPVPKLFYGLNTFSVMIVLMGSILQSCAHHKKTYKSDCDGGHTFKQIGFTQLIDSISHYDKQYVEVSGKYKEGNEQSALFNDSLMVDHSVKNALWVDFSQDCPLYLSGTKIGLFEYDNGQFTQIDGKTITIRGRIDLNNKGHLSQYKGTIGRLSLVKL